MHNDRPALAFPGGHHQPVEHLAFTSPSEQHLSCLFSS
jgi:hypothetical protein